MFKYLKILNIKVVNYKMATLRKFVNKNDLLLSSLKKFYKTSNNYKRLLVILKNETKISLRIIDWFVTNYSKKNNIIYELDKGGTKQKHNISRDQFIVYLNYKSQLKAYSKKQFDPFCRRERIEFSINNEKIITTIGQLNFFKWAIDNKILDYINDNLNTIETDMNKSITLSKNKYNKKKKSHKKQTENKVVKKKKTKRKKRNELSISASRGLNKHNVRVVLEFN